MPLWTDLRECRWAYRGGLLFKIPITPSALESFMAASTSLAGARVHISAGGNVVLLSIPSEAQVEQLDSALRTHGLGALTLWGAAPLWLGMRRTPQIISSIKAALDPDNRFPSLDD